MTGGHYNPLIGVVLSDGPAGIRMRNAGPGWAGHRRIAGMLSLQEWLGVFACVSSVAASCGTMGHLQECAKMVTLL